ncbi:AEC family transporter [Rhodoplanes sp. Z2-YC6860]|uniref:AEC family transporter n=1 Tax=Rhodoplanes sp. Z2-YC6860 TaxID=674703 RepID=UPI00078D0B6B|nr:AEC family transporter [Rhodoplanes sp. Z2-YC6860]AMN42014.1 auxin efflux carrier [Rhodoplanes sp. Z2-YC6860]
MIDVLNLALPYFGLIFLGFASGRVTRIPVTGLAWMDFFILWMTLPALFYRILAKTPFEQLNNVPFIATATLGTFTVLMLSLGIAYLIRRDLAEAAIGQLAGAYGNIGYMGPGLALATVGAQAAAPVALIFCFETLLFFSIVPFLMALARPLGKGFGATALDVVRRIALHPLMVASALGALSAALRFEPPAAIDKLLLFLSNASAPCALFTLGVTVALRRLNGVPWDVPVLVLIKLVLHPVVAMVLLTTFGPFDPNWVKTAVLMAALPPALSVFVLARQYQAWLEPASALVLIGTLISVATLTTVMWLVQNGMLDRFLLR